MTWLHSIFLWFYCQKLSHAALLVVGISALFLLVNHWLVGRRAWRAAVFCLLLLGLAAILWSTAWSRTPDETAREAVLIPFYSYYTVLTGGEPELLRSNFMNILLFYPAGLFAAALLPRRWTLPKKLLCVAGLFAALSLGIECVQYAARIGQAETDDVIHNTLGALLGGLAATLPTTKVYRKQADKVCGRAQTRVKRWLAEEDTRA